MIPKIIHQIHFGHPPAPETQRWMDGIRAMNPDFDYILWSENNIDELNIPIPNDHHPASISNIVRLYAVYTMGGIYLDTDFEAHKPFDEPLLNHGAWVPDKIGGHYCVAAFGAEPSHPWVKWQIDNIPRFVTPSAGWVSDLTDASPVDSISILPVDTFFPYHWNAPENKRVPTQSTYAEHKWAKSWWSRSDHQAAK